MTQAKKQASVTKIEISLDKVNLEEFTWGALEDMESKSPIKIREVLQKFVVVKGVAPEDMGEFLRGLTLLQMRELNQKFQAAITEMVNPVQNGKN